MKKFLIPAAIAALTLATGGAANAATILTGNTTLDDFDASGTALVFFPAINFNTNPQTDIVTDASIVGGERELELNATQLISGFNSASAGVSNGVLNIGNTSGMTSVTTITWDGVGTGDLDLDVSALDNFGFDIQTVDLNVSLQLTVEDGSGNTSSLQKSNLSSGNVLFAFEDFVGSASFADLKSVQLVINAGDSVDVTIDSIRFVKTPEPASLLGLGLVAGLGFLSSKKRQTEA